MSRDIANPMLWIEHLHCPTWSDDRRQRDRATQADRLHRAAADAFHSGDPDGRVRRRLEHPAGSTAGHAEAPDSRDPDLRGAATSLSGL